MADSHADLHPSPVYELLALLEREVLLETAEVPAHLMTALLYAATNTPLLVAGEAKLNGLILGRAGDDYDVEWVSYSATALPGNAEWYLVRGGSNALHRHRLIAGSQVEVKASPSELELSDAEAEFIEPLRDGPLHRDTHRERLSERAGRLVAPNTYSKTLSRARKKNIVLVEGKIVQSLVCVPDPDVT